MKINSFSPVLLYYKAEIEQGRNKSVTAIPKMDLAWSMSVCFGF